MEYISSDTNVWIDFNLVARLEMPFRLECTYIMFEEAIEDEIRSPIGLKEELLKLGLEGVTITTDEYYYADALGEKYPRLSAYDRIALSIAKERSISLLTGDMELRKAAKKEDVLVLGTIGLLDRLMAEKRISNEEYTGCIKDFIQKNGDGIRLPEDELRRRLEDCES